MQTILFDDAGKTWDARAPGLAEALQASLSGEELQRYVVRNLGFVAVSESAGSVSLRLRPSIVSPIALGALLYWLHDRSAERVLISFFDGGWSHELVRSCDEAARRLIARIGFQANDREGDFLNKQLPLDNLRTESPLRAVLQAWSDCAGTYDPERIHPVLQKALNGRYVLVEASPRSPSLVLKDVGTGLTQIAGYWLSRAIGSRVEDQPDYAYGKWVSGLYHRVLSGGKPILEDVDAVVTWPEQPRTSYRYRRLVLPFDTRSNSTVLLGATIADVGIDLRVKSH